MTDSTEASSLESERDPDRQRASNAAQAALREHGRTMRTAITGLTEGTARCLYGSARRCGRRNPLGLDLGAPRPCAA